MSSRRAVVDHPDADQAAAGKLENRERSAAAQSNLSFAQYYVEQEGVPALGAAVDPDGVRDLRGRITLPSDGAASGAEWTALLRAYYLIRADGEATRRAITGRAYRGHPVSDLHRYAGPDDAFATAGAPYLRYFPRIVPPASDVGGVWRFDPDADGSDRPAVPDDPVGPDPERVDAALDAYDFPDPNVAPHIAARNPRGVQEAYDALRNAGRADAADLKSHYHTSTVTADGVFESQDRWWAAVGRPALATLPGVNPPRVVGQEWRFVGVGPADGQDQEDTSEA